MNYLQIAQRAARECGVGAPSSVVSQTGEARRIVDWAASAYDDICGRHRNWFFLRSSFTINTIAATAAYAITSFTDSVSSAAMTVAGFGNWLDGTFKIYLNSSGVATEQEIDATPWDDFRAVWQLGTVTDARPNTFGIRPYDSAIVFGPAPNAVYTVRGDYMKTAAVLTADADTLLIPAKYHMAVVWDTVKRFALYNEASGLYDGAQRSFSVVNGWLETDQLPKTTMALPLV